jgi:hypothetical protein
MKTSAPRAAKRVRHLVLLAALSFGAANSAYAQKITSSIYGDDEFKIFVSTSPNTMGVLFAQGGGYAINFQNNLYLYPGYTDYYLHVWIRDIGGSPTGLLGQFTLTNHRGCRFANGARLLLTTAAGGHWQASARHPLSTPTTGGPTSAPYFNNVLPAFFPATLPVVSLGANSGPNPWPGTKPYARVRPTAHWIWTSSPGSDPEAWLTTRIQCTTATLPAGSNPN